MSDQPSERAEDEYPTPGPDDDAYDDADPDDEFNK